MSDFKAKMHQIRFPLGLRPRPCWGAYRTPRSLAEFKGPTSKGGERKGGLGGDWRMEKGRKRSRGMVGKGRREEREGERIGGM